MEGKPVPNTPIYQDGKRKIVEPKTFQFFFFSFQSEKAIHSEGENFPSSREGSESLPLWKFPGWSEAFYESEMVIRSN